MKYKEDDYLYSDFYGEEDDEIQNKKSKVVTCRKQHACACGCNQTISKGEQALLETGFIDGEPRSVYTKITCIDVWLDEIIEDENNGTI
jgi:hypothetical protein